MDKQNKVSIWVGSLGNSDDLRNYMQENYNEEGDISSSFMLDFEIDYIDNQFQEVYFYENLNSKEDVFNDFSYANSFLGEIPDMNWLENNCIIMLYNFEYDNKVEQNNNIKYIGSFNYEEN